MHACKCLAAPSECNRKSQPVMTHNTATAVSPTLLRPEHNHMPSRVFIKQGQNVRFLTLSSPSRCCNHSDGDERRVVSSVVLSVIRCRRGFETLVRQESQLGGMRAGLCVPCCLQKIRKSEYFVYIRYERLTNGMWNKNAVSVYFEIIIFSFLYRHKKVVTKKICMLKYSRCVFSYLSLIPMQSQKIYYKNTCKYNLIQRMDNLQFLFLVLVQISPKPYNQNV